jgi:hypothetical protein
MATMAGRSRSGISSRVANVRHCHLLGATDQCA